MTNHYRAFVAALLIYIAAAVTVLAWAGEPPCGRAARAGASGAGCN